MMSDKKGGGGNRLFFSRGFLAEDWVVRFFPRLGWFVVARVDEAAA